MTRGVVPISSLIEGAGLVTKQVTGPDLEIVDLFLDSRQVTPWSLFCALPGLETDGARFVPDALRRGARAVLSENPRADGIEEGIAWVEVGNARHATALLAREWHGRPDEAMTLVGVTGTNGKTSVVYLVEAFAKAAGRPAGRIGTVTHAFGDREYQTERTTPEAPELYRLLAAMRDDGVRITAMEVSSHALAMSRVDGARFAIGAFLNLSQDHLDFHDDMGSYFSAKAALIEGLVTNATAVLTADEPRVSGLAEKTTARVVSFGRADGATVRVVDERCAIDGTEVRLEAPGGSYTVRTELAGRFVPDNLAAAAACAIGAGLPMDAVIAGALALRSIPGRMERIEQGQPFTVVVDYAHTEEALRRLLGGIREMVDGRILVVFGCGGDRDRGKRSDMGRAAAETADRIFMTSDNPRGEDPQAILEQIRVGVEAVPGATDRARTVSDRAEAVREAVREARPGDAVVVAGKGHETTQTFADRVEPFDDREVARQALAAVGFRGGCHAGA